MKVLVSTVIRHAALDKENVTGRILEVEWPSGEVVHELPTPLPLHPSSNENPRGGLRGGRGILAANGRYYVANYDTVYVYDPQWRLVDELSHPLAVDIHEIDLEDDAVWLSCSSVDLILKLGLDGEYQTHWHLSDAPSLVRRLGVECPALDTEWDYRQKLPKGLDKTHLNSVQVVGVNELILNLGRTLPTTFFRRALRRLFPPSKTSQLTPRQQRWQQTVRGARDHILHLDLPRSKVPRSLKSIATYRPSHNGRRLPDGSLALNHESGRLLLWGKDGGHRAIEVPGTWWRGLVPVNETQVLVGTGPCAVVEVDLAAESVVRRVQLSEDPNESVHGLEVVAA